MPVLTDRQQWDSAPVPRRGFYLGQCLDLTAIKQLQVSMMYGESTFRRERAMKILAWLCIFVLATSLQAKMLAEIHWNLEEQSGFPLCSGPLVVHKLKFLLAYEEDDNIEDANPYYDVQVGGSGVLDDFSIYIAPPTITREYNSNNTPDFDSFSSLITDGIDQRLIVSALITDAGAILSHGRIRYRWESDWLGEAPNLACSQIDFVRLLVNERTAIRDSAIIYDA